jgi:hypothetical protein
MPPTTRNFRRSDPSVLSKVDAERAKLLKERQAAEKELQRQMDTEKEKREAEKKLRDEERKREEEAKKQADDAKRMIEDANAARISSEESIRRIRSNSDGNDSINGLLQSGGADMELDIDFGYGNEVPPTDDVLRSPPKKNARFSNIVHQLQPSYQNPTPAKEPGKQTKSTKMSQLKKSALKLPIHKHSHPRTIVESSILLPSDKAENCFIEASENYYETARWSINILHLPLLNEVIKKS